MLWFKKSKANVTRLQAAPELPKIPFPKGHTLATWRANPALISQWAEFEKTELYRHFLSVLVNQIPAGYPVRGQVVNDTMMNVEFGSVRGHLNVLNLIQSLGRLQEQPKELLPDYGAEIEE